MNWEQIGVGCTVFTVTIGAIGGIVKLLLDGAITKLHLLIASNYVTKTECEKHRSHCAFLKQQQKEKQ